MSGRIKSSKAVVSTNTLPEIGKIKIGEKNERGLPTSLDYFKPDDKSKFAGEFKTIYGDQPRKLNIAFISNNIEEVCNERFECWDNGKRWGWGDGELFTVFDKSVGRYGEYVNNLPKTDNRVTALKWDRVLTLRFVLLEMRGVMGYWTFQSKGGMVTIPSIVAAFDFVMNKAGNVAGFPFTLMVEKKKGYSPGAARNYPVVTLVPNFAEDKLLLVKNYLDEGGSINNLSVNAITSGELKKPLQITQEATEETTIQEAVIID